MVVRIRLDLLMRYGVRLKYGYDICWLWFRCNVVSEFFMMLCCEFE